MRLATPGSPLTLTPPRVVWRSALGVGVVLLLLQALMGGSSTSSESSAVMREQAQLRLDPNVAAREELMLLPGIGPALADAIIEYRESADLLPAFSCAEDLDNVHRIGPATVAKLRPLLRFQPEGHDRTGREVRTP
jgi:competence ComEA-like helix-hairpin-helix protein